jgi:hypothetical protein
MSSGALKPHIRAILHPWEDMPDYFPGHTLKKRQQTKIILAKEIFL